MPKTIIILCINFSGKRGGWAWYGYGVSRRGHEQNKMSRIVGCKFPYFQEKKNTFNNSSKKTVHEKKICPAEWVDKLT